MKKLTALLLTITLLVSQIAFATDNNPKHTEAIAIAIENSKFSQEQIDIENIFIVKNTSYINIKNNISPALYWVALPILNTNDISFATFENDEYKNAVTNFVSLNGMTPPYNGKLNEYINNNDLSKPTEVTNLWISERVHLFAYKVICDNKEYIIPDKFADFSIFNVTDDDTCVLEIGKAYATDEFVAICEAEDKLYNDYKAEERKKENRPVISLDENGDEIVKVNGVNLDDALELTIESIQLMNTGATIKFGIKSETDDYMTTYRKQKEADISEVISFAEQLFDELKTQVAAGKPSDAENTSECIIKGNIKIRVWNDGVSISVNKNNKIEFKIRSSEPIIQILKKYSYNAFDGFTCEKNDENTPHIRESIDGFIKTDIIEFEYELPEDSENNLCDEVGEYGEVIKCIFEKYKENKYNSTYILTFKGSKGTISLYTQMQSSLDGTQELYSNNIPISFRNKYRFENGNLVEYKAGKTNHKYKIKIIFTSGESNNLQEVYINDEKCMNLKYTRLTDDTKLSEQYVEKDKKTVLKEAQECADSLYDKGLFKGTDKGYELEKSLTREESATILVRLLGKENEVLSEEFEQVFKDVDKDRWSYAYVMYCYDNNITKGTSFNTFSPDETIDTPQFIALIMRLLGYTEVDPDNAFDKSIEHKLLPEEMVDELKASNVFTRGKMVQIVYNSIEFLN